MLYMVTFTINIPPMLAYIYHTWILWVLGMVVVICCGIDQATDRTLSDRDDRSFHNDGDCPSTSVSQ